MLDALDQIPWPRLKHAYGSAKNIPQAIRALVSEETDQRKRAQETLYSAAFHQGSIYTCTPYVARFLIELVDQETVEEREWCVLYISRLDRTAREILSYPETLPNDHDVDEWTGMTNAVWRRSERRIALQIREELQQNNEVFFRALKSSRPAIRLASLPYLIAMIPETDQALHSIQQAFDSEDDEEARAGMALALGSSVPLDAESMIEAILSDEREAILVRIAAGFGWVINRKGSTSDAFLHKLAALIHHESTADMLRLYAIHRDMLFPVWLLASLFVLSSEQKQIFLMPLLSASKELPLNASGDRIGGVYYRDTLVMMAFPDGVLPPETTLHDLSDLQRRVFKRIYTRDVQARERNLWYFQDTLGIDVSSEAELQSFIAGERITRQTGSAFDQKLATRIRINRRKSME